MRSPLRAELLIIAALGATLGVSGACGDTSQSTSVDTTDSIAPETNQPDAIAPDATPAGLSATIGADGGRLAADGIEFIVPPGALDEDTDITVRVSARQIEGAVLYGPVLDLEPEGLVFAKPAAIRFQLPSDVTEAVILLTKKQDPTEFQSLDTLVADGVAQALIPHFSTVYVADPNNPGTRRPYCCEPLNPLTHTDADCVLHTPTGLSCDVSICSMRAGVCPPTQPDPGCPPCLPINPAMTPPSHCLMNPNNGVVCDPDICQANPGCVGGGTSSTCDHCSDPTWTNHPDFVANYPHSYAAWASQSCAQLAAISVPSTGDPTSPLYWAYLTRFCAYHQALADKGCGPLASDQCNFDPSTGQQCPAGETACADGSCVPTGTPCTCAQNNLIECSDGTCAASADRCPDAQCRSNNRYWCADTNRCVDNVLACPCSGGGQRCSDGTCSAPGTPCTCAQNNLIECSDGTCAASADRCPDAQCRSNNRYWCADTNRCEDNVLACPCSGGGQRCSDGTCSAPGTPCTCAQNGLVTCSNGTCAASADRCPDAQCRSNNRYWCADTNRCVDNVLACPCSGGGQRCSDGTCSAPGTPCTCAQNGLVTCSNGTCAASADRCPDAQCRSNNRYWCAEENRCLDNAQACPCSGGGQRCSDGSCSAPGTPCPCPNGGTRCTDGTCVPAGTPCPCPNGGTRCTDGTCVPAGTPCPCPNGGTRCPNGTCVPPGASCGCASGAIQCPDGSCVPPGTSCPTDCTIPCEPIDPATPAAWCASNPNNNVVCDPDLCQPKQGCMHEFGCCAFVAPPANAGCSAQVTRAFCEAQNQVLSEPPRFYPGSACPASEPRCQP